MRPNLLITGIQDAQIGNLPLLNLVAGIEWQDMLVHHHGQYSLLVHGIELL